MLNVIYYKVGATDFSAQQWRHQTWMKSVDWLWFMPLGHFFERHLSLEHWNWTSDRWFNKSHYSRTQIENWDQFRSFFWYIPSTSLKAKWSLKSKKSSIFGKLYMVLTFNGIIIFILEHYQSVIIEREIDFDQHVVTYTVTFHFDVLCKKWHILTM